MLQKHGRCYWDYVYTGDGRRVRRSLGTNDRTTAREMERMLSVLRGRREWPLLDAVALKQLTAGKLYDYWRGGEDGLREVRAMLADLDLAELVEDWARWAEGRARSGTVAKYEKQLRTLIPEGTKFLRSQFTRRHLSEALAALKCSGSTKRRYHAAWSSFGSFLVEREAMDANPMRSVRPPRNNDPRTLWFPLADVLRLVDGQPEPFRALAALREGAGVEISAALSVRRSDVDLDNSTVHVHGTKNLGRDRVVVVEDWAVARLAGYLRQHPMTGAAFLFEGVTPRRAFDVQRAALKALKLNETYRLHDARHSYAVRMMKAGADPQIIANNLGHVDATMVLRVYGKYRPSLQDLAREQLRGAQG